MKNLKIYESTENFDLQLLNELSCFSVSDISDAIDRNSALNSHMTSYNSSKLAGFALTVEVPEGDNLLVYKAIAMAKKGQVLVISTRGSVDRAICGEILARYAQSQGITGFVIDGAIRDVEYIEQQTSFAVFAKGISANGPYKNGMGSVNIPISLGGKIINPGDILLGDKDGVIIIPQNEARDLIKKSRAIYEKGQSLIEKINTNSMDISWIDTQLQSYK